MSIYYKVGSLVSKNCGGILSVLLLLTSYLVWYSGSTFNESVAFFLFSYLTYLLLLNKSFYKIAFVIFLCTITKEVAFPIIVYIIFITLLIKNERLDKDLLIKSKKFFLLMGPIFLGVFVNFTFNYFRFGVIYNKFNMDPIFILTINELINNFYYLFFSPNSGLFFVWLSLSFYLCFQLGNAFFKNKLFKLFSLLLILIGICLVNLGLAKWYSPFGWIAWGPRLTLPYLGSFILLLIYIGVDDLVIFLKKVGSLMCFFAIFVVASVSLLINIAVSLETGLVFQSIFAPTKTIIEAGIEPFAVQLVPHDIFFVGLSEQMSRSLPSSLFVKVFEMHPILLAFIEINLLTIIYFLYKDIKNTNLKSGSY